MPRGRKKKVELSFSERYEALKNEVQELENNLKVKKAEIKKMEKAAEEEKAKELMEAITSSGKSLEDVMEFLKSE